jgi:hypothetical protein
VRAISRPAARNTILSGAVEYRSGYISYDTLAVVYSISYYLLTLKAISPLLTVASYYRA